MNDPNKAINVNLSSLLSLKAELLRKQAEVNKAKATTVVSNQPNEYNSNRSSYNSADRESKRDKKLRAKEVEKQDDATVYEHEDSQLLEKSRRILEAKSKFYERMTRTGGQLNSDDNCLVLFNRKHQDERVNVADGKDENTSTNHVISSDIDTDSEAERGTDKRYDDDDDEGDWVEYTDCLGRTRKCLREDLEAVKRRDAELATSMPERLDQSKANWMITMNETKDKNEDEDTLIGPMPSESVVGDGISMMSKHDEQRANWERKELENLDKIDVHYQDVFFDEARQHGVGYYAFSTDEEERKKQQKELEETRKRTIAEQKRREELRLQREKIIAERVRAAKNRQRARLGLPPLEEEESKKKNADDAVKETKAERKARKRAEKIKRKQEEEERQREMEREQYVRPWDKEKLGIASQKLKEDNDDKSEPKWVYRPERVPMSQEEWNEKKRAERITEFAPVVNELSTSAPPTEHHQYQLKRTNFTSMPPPPPPLLTLETIPTNKHISTATLLETDESFITHQTSKKKRQFHRRNCESHCEQPEEEGLHMGAAIPPPIDLGYVTPPHAKKPKSGHQLEQSIEAGLRFLRNNSDQGTLTTKSSWAAKADY
ncbi:coiled-coil domain-containing protein 174 [Eurosta solidaginis]|uniref:coiled-coil domain-containing protein 174 n=1 Tax=Eurosta solidaginis TaxID=178769 RepID=UPI003530E972